MDHKHKKAILSLDRTSTNFTYAVNESIRQIKWSDDLDFLKYYQNIVRAFLAEIQLQSRGLLIYHGMGVGKSMLAISIAIDMLANKSSMPVILLLAKSLQSNMRNTIYKYISMRSVRDPSYPLGHLSPAELEKWIDKNFRFVSLNSNNMTSQLGEAINPSDKGPGFDDRVASLAQLPSLDGRLLIVDEAHVLFRSITNGSENSLRLYNTIIQSSSARIVFCTGTPMASHPFELVPCFNMLAARTGSPLLPEQYEDFVRLFIQSDGSGIRNRHLLQNRIMGLVSHITAESTPGAGIGRKSRAEDVQFPDLLPLKIVEVQMSPLQWGGYTSARERERQEGIGGKSSGRAMVKPKGMKSSTYRTKSRQISNYLAPINSPTSVSSPKFEAIANDMAGAGKCIVYTAWVNTGGIAPFSQYLVERGWKLYDKKNGGDSGSRQFITLTNEISADRRDELIRIYNSSANLRGEIIAAIVLSKVAAIGIDLRGVRSVFLMEPPWKMGDMDQVIYRAVRNGSHSDLPPDERIVQPFLYLSVPPQGELEPGTLPLGVNDISQLPESEREEALERGRITTDVDIFLSAQRTGLLIDSFAKVLQSVSIECMHNAGNDCYTCAPTNESLFTPGPGGWWRDEVLPNPCRKTGRREVQAETVPGLPEILYRRGGPIGYEFYYWDANLGQHFALPGSDPRYSQALTILQNSDAPTN